MTTDRRPLHHSSPLRMIAAALLAATTLLAVPAPTHAADAPRSLRVKRVRAHALAGPAALLAIHLQLSRAADVPQTHDPQAHPDPERFRIHLTAPGQRWRSAWIEAPRGRLGAHPSMTCVLRLADHDSVPDDVSIAVVAADGRLLARTRCRRPTARSEPLPARSASVSALAPASIDAMEPLGDLGIQPLEPPPSVQLSWGQLKRRYLGPAALAPPARLGAVAWSISRDTVSARPRVVPLPHPTEPPTPSTPASASVTQ
jgi:hypothetical protein